MKKLSDKEVYNSYYKYILISYNVKVKPEYQFIYDEFLNHLILDCKKIKENFNQAIFRGQFYQHFKSRDWYDKLMTPEKCPETIKRLRNYKLEKINGNYGN